MKEWLQGILDGWKGKIPLPALLVMAIGCLLLLLPAGESEEKEVLENTGPAEFRLLDFEERLSQVLSQVSGAGETRVILSLDSGNRTVLAQDRQQNDGGNTSEIVILEERSGGEAVVPVQTIAPNFRGAVVVSAGAQSAAVRLALTQAVSVLTGLGTDRICVCAGNS